MTPTQVSPLQHPSLGEAYQTVYDLLGTLYWESSDLPTKDLVFGAREAVGEILDAVDQQGLVDNTKILNALLPKITMANTALKEIQAGISSITRNLNTAANLVAAVSKVLSLVPRF